MPDHRRQKPGFQNPKNRREKMQTYNNTTVVQKFRDAEQLWFWFISSSRIREGMRRAADGGGFRPCEIVDVETLVTRLFLSGRLSREQLEIMKQYGERRRPPNQHIWAENRAAMLWSDAMRTLQMATSAKGWVE